MLKQHQTVKHSNPQVVAWSKLLRELLGRVPFARILDEEEAPQPDRPEVDLKLSVKLGNKDWALLVDVKSSGQPRFTRNAAIGLRQALDGEARAYGVVAAPFISAETRDFLRSMNLGWLDLAGNALLSFDSIHIEIEKAQSDPFTTKRAQRSVFAPKSARLLRIMLTNPGPWKVTDLSERAGVSLGQVSNVRRMLLNKEWAEIDPAGGLRLRQPAAVLNSWRDAAQPPVVAFKGYTTMHGKMLEDQLREVLKEAERQGARLMLAGHSVARRLAPYARVAGEFLYADDKGLELLKSSLRLVPADRGENVTVFEAPDEGLWAESFEQPLGMRSASLIQTYLDLWSTGERGREAAEHFREEMMAPHLVR